ncbi:MAG: flagellar basal body-associated FliL family protein [SAR324 cluster bacterium]|nr:flagellar basal body-associated FliL family protein [SAR324 cluster bacterium]MBL7034674.1 flagellar basal body-associated FliL family protein [SAR324 cluster bacterium]
MKSSAAETGDIIILNPFNQHDVSLLEGRPGTAMIISSKLIYIVQYLFSVANISVKFTIILLLLLSGLFFSSSALNAQEEVVEEIRVIREGPPPLVAPQYLDLGTFVVNMPGDKYFLKSSIQLAFENVAAKDWLLARLPIAKDLVITHLNSITIEQFDNIKNRTVIKNDLQVRLNSLFPNKSPWEDAVPIRRILFLEFYRQ